MAPPVKNLKGKRLCDLIVLRQAEQPANRRTPGTYWLVRCKLCRTEFVRRGSTLLAGSVTHQPCLRVAPELDLTGKRSGNVTILRQTKRPDNQKMGGTYWLAECGLCKSQFVIRGIHFRFRPPTNCGCSNPRVIDLTGRSVGRLRVLGRTSQPKHLKNDTSCRAWWECECECGTHTILSSYSLLHGLTQSCGCLRRELSSRRAKQNTAYHTPEVKKKALEGRVRYWTGPDGEKYRQRASARFKKLWVDQTERYGARQVWDNHLKRWVTEKSSYRVRLEQSQAKRTPEREREIRQAISTKMKQLWQTPEFRTKVVGAYHRYLTTKGRTKKHKAPKRPNTLTSLDGRTHTLTEWAQIAGLSATGLRYRLEKMGWTLDRAISTPRTDPSSKAYTPMYLRGS